MNAKKITESERIENFFDMMIKEAEQLPDLDERIKANAYLTREQKEKRIIEFFEELGVIKTAENEPCKRIQ